MKTQFTFVLLLFIAFKSAGQPSYDDSDSYVLKSPYLITMSVVYEVAPTLPKVSIGALPLTFNNYSHYLGFSQKNAERWTWGHIWGYQFSWLLGGNNRFDETTYKLRGMNADMRYGYLLSVFPFLSFEPNIGLGYANLSVKTPNSRLITHGFTTRLTADFHIMSKASYNTKGMKLCWPTATLSGGYVWAPFNTSWKRVDDFNPAVSVAPFNWNGWYAGVKIYLLRSPQ